MKIAILGPGCANCVTLDRRVRDAVADLGLAADIEKVTDYAAIAAYGLMRTPGLVIDGEVVVSGRVPSGAEIRELIGARAA